MVIREGFNCLHHAAGIFLLLFSFLSFSLYDGSSQSWQSHGKHFLHLISFWANQLLNCTIDFLSITRVASWYSTFHYCCRISFIMTKTVNSFAKSSCDPDSHRSNFMNLVFLCFSQFGPLLRNFVGIFPQRWWQFNKNLQVSVDCTTIIKGWGLFCHLAIGDQWSNFPLVNWMKSKFSNEQTYLQFSVKCIYTNYLSLHTHGSTINCIHCSGLLISTTFSWFQGNYPAPLLSAIEPPEDSIAALISMGFERSAARQALIHARNDINAATNILLESHTLSRQWFGFG